MRAQYVHKSCQSSRTRLILLSTPHNNCQYTGKLIGSDQCVAPKKMFLVTKAHSFTAFLSVDFRMTTGVKLCRKRDTHSISAFARTELWSLGLTPSENAAS